MTLVVEQGALFGPAPVVGVSRGPVMVREIPKDEADAIIRAGHYSGSVVWSSSIHLGVFYEDALIGAMQFGVAMNPAAGERVVSGSTVDSWLELNRLWLADDKPANTTSRAIACALTYVRHTRPRVEWVQSFADARCGKLGATYQACSFLYLGSHSATFYRIGDVWVHKSMIGRKATDARGWGTGPKIAWVRANEHRAVPHTFEQYRYVKFLRSSARRRLVLPEMPYPKPETKSAPPEFVR